MSKQEFSFEELTGSPSQSSNQKEFSFEELSGQVAPAKREQKQPLVAPKNQDFISGMFSALAPETTARYEAATSPTAQREVLEEGGPVGRFVRGVSLSPERMFAAGRQFVPGQREAGTRQAQEIEAELSESPTKRIGATAADILGIGKLTPLIKGATAGERIAKAGLLGGGITAATTPVEKDVESFQQFLGEKLKQGAIGFGFGTVPQAGIEGARKFLFPGSMLTANAATQKTISEAVQRGYTIPISEITNSAALQTLDRLFDSPLVQRNAPLFAETINKLMGQTGREISPDLLNKAYKDLSTEIVNLTKNKQIDLRSLPPQLSNIYAQTFQAIPDIDPKKLQKILVSLQNVGTTRAQIDGTTWHETRQLLQRNARGLIGQPGYQQANDLVKAWDDVAFNSIKDPNWKGAFTNWKTKYTVFSDVDEAVNANPTARSNFVKGILDPEDLRNVIAQKRPTEFTRRTFVPQTGAPTGQAPGRAQTTESAVAGGLNLFGRQPESVAPYYRAAPALKVLGTMVGAKNLQNFLYSPEGQQALMYGLQPSQLRTLTRATSPFATDLARFIARESSGE